MSYVTAPKPVLHQSRVDTLVRHGVPARKPEHMRMDMADAGSIITSITIIVSRLRGGLFPDVPLLLQFINRHLFRGIALDQLVKIAGRV